MGAQPQEDPDKYFGTTEYFRNKDEQRRNVNDMRREERNKRILEQYVARNAKKIGRAGGDPSALLLNAEKAGLNPLEGGGFGQEASQRDAELRARAAALFEETSKQKAGETKVIGNQEAQKATDVATNPATTINPTTQSSGATTYGKPTSGIGSSLQNTANPITLPSSLTMDAGKDGKEFTTDLGKRANSVFLNQGIYNDSDKKAFESGIRNAIGMAKTPQEINELRSVSQKAGIFSDRFNKFVPSDLLEGAPDWASNVKNDKTFKGQDLTRFAGMTRDEAREQIMKERSSALMKSFDNQGQRIASQQKQLELNNKKMQADAERETNSYLSDAGKLGAKARIEKFGVERASEIFFNSQKLREELDNSSNLQRILLDDNNKSFPITSTNENMDMKNYQYVFNQLNKTLNPYS